jgi:hypothetical protein
MPAEYPDAIFAPRTIENRPGVSYDPDDTKTLYAEDLQALGNEIVAIENALGTNPEGVAANVGARIEAIEDLQAIHPLFASGQYVPTSADITSTSTTLTYINQTNLKCQLTLTKKCTVLVFLHVQRILNDTGGYDPVIAIGRDGVSNVAGSTRLYTGNAVVAAGYTVVGAFVNLDPGTYTFYGLFSNGSGGTVRIKQYATTLISAIAI